MAFIQVLCSLDLRRDFDLLRLYSIYFVRSTIKGLKEKTSMEKMSMKNHREIDVEAILIKDNNVETNDGKNSRIFTQLYPFSFSLLFCRSHERFDDYVMYSSRIDPSVREHPRTVNRWKTMTNKEQTHAIV